MYKTSTVSHVQAVLGVLQHPCMKKYCKTPLKQVGQKCKGMLVAFRNAKRTSSWSVASFRSAMSCRSLIQGKGTRNQ